ncbi:hypothetical protein [Marinobacter sp. F3R11]|uniref:hypothetical protein n=1 Tax=Marinobacter sp. F3R11 TaxID=2267231 RepID=UPI001651AD0C|nr:hypothetical protein [Marinobacter sp. F3R11]
MSDLPIAVVGEGSVQDAITQADGQAMVGIAAEGEAVNAGEQAVPVVLRLVLSPA